MHNRREDIIHISKILRCPECEEIVPNGRVCDCGWVNPKYRTKKKGGAVQAVAKCKYCDEPVIGSYGFCYKHDDAWQSIQHSKKYMNQLTWRFIGLNCMQSSFNELKIPQSWREYQKNYQRRTAEMLKEEVLNNVEKIKSLEIQIKKFVILEPEVFSEVDWNKYREETIETTENEEPEDELDNL